MASSSSNQTISHFLPHTDTDIENCSYDVTHRIYCASTYPCTSPNGSSITIYGHEQGLRIMWRGGKPLRSSSPEYANETVNGTKSSDSMVIDLDDDEPETVSKPAEAQFEDQEEETNPLEPYSKIIRFIDISLGTEARHLSTPTLPIDLSQSAPGTYPPVFSTNMIIAVACSDCSIRLVTLPLSPPPKDVEDSSKSGVRIVGITGPYSHHDLPSSISVTHTGVNTEGDERVGSRSRSRGAASTNPASKPWSFLIASTSPTAGGQLLIHQISLVNGSKIYGDDLIPIQRRHLNTGVGCKVVFNPAAYPAERHSNLLIAYPSGCVKLYQCFQASNSRHPRGRRGSTTTTDSSLSRSSRQVQGGRFLLVLQTPFFQASQAAPRRERVLASNWVLDGRGIIALLESGNWGIWDIEGAGRSLVSGPQSLFRGQANASGISEGGLTNFSLTGLIQPEINAKHSLQSDAQEANPRALASKTPNTRKAQSEALFKGHDRRIATSSEFASGSISIAPIFYPDSPRSTSLPDESIVFAYGSYNVFIPSLSAFWRARVSEKGTLNSSFSSRPITLERVRLPGGPQICVVHLPRPWISSNRRIALNSMSHKAGLPEILVAYGRRLVYLVQPLEEPNPGKADRSHSKALTTIDNRYDEDQMLLDQGELDIGGMDRILDGMNGNALPAASGVQTSSILGESTGPPSTLSQSAQAGRRNIRPGSRPVVRSKLQR